MEAYQAIITRRSIRTYTGQTIDEEVLSKIIRGGMQAPSAHDRRPWHFIVVTDREKLEAVPRFHPYAAMLKNAALAIVICGDKQLEKDNEYLLLNCAAATENMLLAAHALGVGGVWVAVAPRPERMQGISRLLNLPDAILPVAMVALGYPAGPKSAVDRYDPSRIHYNQW